MSEERKGIWFTKYQHVAAELAAVTAERDAMRKTVEWYADLDNWSGIGAWDNNNQSGYPSWDMGDRARSSLEVKTWKK